MTIVVDRAFNEVNILLKIICVDISDATGRNVEFIWCF